MAIEIVTGLKEKAHVDANDIAGFQQGVVGTKDYVMGVGKKAKATLVSNNSVRIDDGELVMQGVHFRILPGTYENVTINNGNQGMKRKDLIVARYTKNSGSGIENITLAVLQGTPTSGTAVAPVPTTGDIRSGALKHEMPLYVVELNGLNVVSVTPAFKILMNMKELQDGLDELNSKLEDSGWVDCTLGTNISIDNPENGKPKVRKIGNMVILSGTIKSNTTWSDHDALIKIPDGYRPKKYERFICAATGQYMHRLDIPPSGTCTDHILNGKQIPSGGWLQLEGIWYV